MTHRVQMEYPTVFVRVDALLGRSMSPATKQRPSPVGACGQASMRRLGLDKE